MYLLNIVIRGNDMKLRCINNNNGFCELTIGMDYDFIDYGDHFKEYYCVINDADLKYAYHKSYFKIVEEDTDKNNNQDVTITLTKDEVNTLTALLCAVNGTAKSPRRHIDSAVLKVCLGITYHKYTQLTETHLLSIKDGCILFNDYPEEKSPKQLKIEELQGTIEEMEVKDEYN